MAAISELEEQPNCTAFAEWFQLDGEQRHLIWYLCEGCDDRVHVDDEGWVPSFRSLDDALTFAKAAGIDLDTDYRVAVQNYDVIVAWLRNPTAEGVDCVEFLNAFNMFFDVANTKGIDYDPWDENTIDVYNKVFWGNNLPAMTPEGEHYDPVWDDDEVKRIADSLAAGLAIFRRVVQLRP